MKKKIMMVLLVMMIVASVFTGCGNRMEGDGNVQAAMADSGDGQEEKGDITESGTEETETVKSTETEEPEDGSIPEANAEPSEGSVESSATGHSDTEMSAQTSTQAGGSNTDATGTQANGSSSTATGTQTSTQADANTAEGGSSSSGTMSGFLDYLNQQRAAIGLSAISWDSGLAAEAQRRAEEVVSNFSHDGSGNYLENLYKGGSNSIEDVYSAWYNSPGHQATMLHVNAARAGVAFVEVDGYYYVVLVEETETPTIAAEDWNDYKEEKVENGEWIQLDEHTWATPGVEIVTEDDPMYDEIMSWDWGLSD